MSAVTTRLARLARLSPAELTALRAAEDDQRRSPARREISAEREALHEQRAILSGWACRQRTLSDGRRQIFSVLLPGDLIVLRRRRDIVADTTFVASSDVVTCPFVPAGSDEGGLAEAYAVAAALEEHHLVAQIGRLGRLSARERMADWLLETRDRLTLAGVCEGDSFRLPLTQEVLADLLGLTSVHVNRTLQALRAEELVAARGGMMTILDVEQLAKLADYRPARVWPNV